MTKNLRIAIHKDNVAYSHSTGWTEPWIAYCKKNSLNFDELNCYRSDIIGILKNYDCLLWHFSNYNLQDMLFARSILNSAQRMGIKVFPDFNTAWHFDDKIAETYLLQSANAPMPKSWVFYSREECIAWLQKKAQYSLVAKLRSGSGSNNVRLIENQAQAIAYAKKMFKNGYRNIPSLIFKTKSNIKSAGDWITIKSRLKRIPEFMRTVSDAKLLPRERGYAYFQEFIPNDGYDIKIVVIGDKQSFIVRKTRQDDFRASGGGALFFDKTLITSDIIQSAYETSDKLGFQCMGYDYVIDNRIKRGKIVEVSYGFSHLALLQAGGYWDKSGIWHNEPLNAPEEILKNLINSSNW